MSPSFIGTWTGKSFDICGESVALQDCFHVSLEKNMFWANYQDQEYITCLKANYLFIYLRLQPVFYQLLCRKDIYIEGKKFLGKFKTCITNQAGYRIEQVVDPNRRSMTQEPEDVLFDCQTLNPKKVALEKLKADELCIKHKRIKLGIRDRRHNFINLTVTLYAETEDGFVYIGEWTSNTINVRFGNCSENSDLRGIPARDRERSFSAQLYKEILAFQKIPSCELKKLNLKPSLPSPVLRFSPNLVISTIPSPDLRFAAPISMVDSQSQIELTNLNQQEIKDIESIRDILLQEGINDDLLSFDNSNQIEKTANITYPNNGNNLFNDHDKDLDVDEYDDFNIDEQTWNELQEQATQKLLAIDSESKQYDPPTVQPIVPVQQINNAFITPATFKAPPVMSSQMMYPISSQKHEDPKLKELESALMEKQGEITFIRNKMLKLTEMNNELIKKNSIREDTGHKSEIERLKVELEFMKQELKTVRDSKRVNQEPLQNFSQNIPVYPRNNSSQRKKMDDFDMSIHKVKNLKKKDAFQENSGIKGRDAVLDTFDAMDVDFAPEPVPEMPQAKTSSVETSTFRLIDVNTDKELILLLSQYLSYSDIESFFLDKAEFLHQHPYIVEIVLLLIEFQDYKLPSELIPQLYHCESDKLYKLLILLVQDGHVIEFEQISPNYDSTDYIRLLHLVHLKQNYEIDVHQLNSVTISHELVGLYCTLKQSNRVLEVLEYYKESKDSLVFYLLHMNYLDKEMLDFKEFCMVKIFLEEYDLEKRWTSVQSSPADTASKPPKLKFELEDIKERKEFVPHFYKIKESERLNNRLINKYHKDVVAAVGTYDPYPQTWDKGNRNSNDWGKTSERFAEKEVEAQLGPGSYQNTDLAKTTLNPYNPIYLVSSLNTNIPTLLPPEDSRLSRLDIGSRQDLKLSVASRLSKVRMSSARKSAAEKIDIPGADIEPNSPISPIDIVIEPDTAQ
ncbi:hypothetical protein HDV01_002586 [Terramyces sp. JEL0728]|nr:hypothetical protein HDV01_002586 [Terramyces sp. JEL0728]